VPVPVGFDVQISELELRQDDIGGCSITGRVDHAFPKPKTDLHVSVGGYLDGDLVMGGFTFVDKLFPNQPATFEVIFFSPAECPDGPLEVRSYIQPDEYDYLY